MSRRAVHRWTIKGTIALGVAVSGLAAVLVALAVFVSAPTGQTNTFTAGSVGSGQQPGATVSGRDVALSWSAATNATSYTAARSNVSPQALSTTLHGSCASSVVSTACTDSGVPESGGSATNWTYTDTPHLNSWNGPASAPSVTVTVPAPALSLVTTTFTDSGGSTNATVSNYFDNEGVTFCLDTNVTPCTSLGTGTVPASGGSTTDSISIPSGTSAGGHTVYAVGSLGSLASEGITVTSGVATQLVFTTQPVAGASGAALTTQPVIKVEDSSNDVVTTSSQTITLNASGGTLTNCAGLTASAGVITVSGCTFAGTVGTNYTLTATTTSSPVVTGTSANFSPSTFGTATQLVFTTQPVAGASGAAFTTQPVIKVEDSGGNVVTSSAQTITLNASGGTLTNCSGLTAVSGVFTVSGCKFAGVVGTNYTLTATTTSSPVVTGTSATFSPSTFGAATQLAFTTQPVAGASGAAFSTQPVIAVEDSAGNVVTSSTQTITLNASGGTLSSCSGLTAVSGVFTVSGCTFAGTVGTNYTLTATTTSAPVVTGTSGNFSPTTFGTATQLVFTAQPVAGASGAAFATQPIIKVEDSAGNVVTGSTQTITLAASGGTLSNCSGLTAVSGVLTVSGCKFAGTVGANYTLTATTTSAPVVTGTSNNFSPTTFGTATQLVFTTQPVAGASGAAFTTQPVVKVEDSGGNVVTSSSQTMSLTPSGGTLSNCSGLTASSGVFTVANCKFAGLVGTSYTLTAQTTSGVSVSGVSNNFSPTTFGTATQLVFTTQPVAGASGAAFTTQPVVKVEDSGGNVVTSSAQTMSLTPSGGALSSCSGLTAVSGVYTVANCTFAGTVGTNYTLTAQTTSGVSVSGVSATFSPSTFGTATQLVYTAQPAAGASGAAFTTQPVIAIEDSAGNVVTSSGQTITLNASGGTLSNCSGLTASSGIISVSGCTFAGKVGTNYTLTATTTSAPVVTGTSNSFSPTTFGTATQLVFTTPPVAGASGTAFTTQPVVKVEDSGGNVVTSSAQTMSLTPSGGSLSNCSGLTASSGVFTVANCTFAGLVGTNYTLTAQTTSGVSVSGISANFSPTTFGTATQLVFATQPIAGASGAAFTTQPVVKVEDSGGNVVTSSSQTITLVASGGTLSNCSGLTAASGVVTVTGCKFAGTVGTNYTLTATTTSAPVVTGTSAGFSPSTFGTATQLVFTTQPVAGASGAAFATQPVIAVEDSAGNVVTSSSQTITLVASGGTLSSCSGLTAVSGVFTVTGCTFAGTVGTNYTLTATTTAAPIVTGTSANFSPSTFGTATQIVLSGSTADLPIGSTRQLTATVEDSAGNIVTSGADSTASITFARTAGTGSVIGLGSSAAISGVASDTVTGATAGSVTLRASGTINGSATNSNTLTFSVDAVNSVDLYTEVHAYNGTHTTNNSSNVATDFSFYSGAKNDQGGSVTWTNAALTDGSMTYTASSASNGKWSNGNAGPIGPFTTSPFNGVSVTPGPTNSGGQQGFAAVTKLTVPAAPSGSYQAGATIQVQATWTSGTGSSVWVYLLDSTGAVVAGSTNPVQVQSGSSMNTTFSIATPSTGTVYYVAVAPTSSTTTTATLDVTAALPYR